MGDTASRTTDWIIFAVTAVITIFFIFWKPEWFWVFLPFPLTYLTKALDMM